MPDAVNRGENGLARHSSALGITQSVFSPAAGLRPSQQARRLMAPVGEKRVGRNRVQALAAGRDRQQPMGIEWGSWFGAAE